MALTVLTNAKIIVNGVDLSDHVTKVTTEDNRDASTSRRWAPNKTSRRASATARSPSSSCRTSRSARCTRRCSRSSLETGVTIEVRAVNAARSATNPAALMTGAADELHGVDGAVGDASKITAEFQNASQTGITYPTA
jgi:hypothetical protein